MKFQKTFGEELQDTPEEAEKQKPIREFLILMKELLKEPAISLEKKIKHQPDSINKNDKQ